MVFPFPFFYYNTGILLSFRTNGVAYLPGEGESRDMCILEAGGEEGLWMAEFDLELLRSYRRQEVHGNAYRRPELYGLLTEDAVRPPFVRKDRRMPVL